MITRINTFNSYFIIAIFIIRLRYCADLHTVSYNYSIIKTESSNNPGEENFHIVFHTFSK